MPDLPATSVWTDIGTFFLGLLEDTTAISIVDPDPTTLTPIPEGLGGSAGNLPGIAAEAAQPDSFLELLRAKAHYLLLPETLIEQLRDTSVGLVFAGLGVNSPSKATSTTLQLNADMPAYLAVIGADLGRKHSGADAAPLGVLYGELCRAWLQLVGTDDTWTALRAAGIAHYQVATTADGTAVDPETAWIAAAVEYVSVRVQAWFTLLTRLSNALLAAGTVQQAQLGQTVADACAGYDAAFDQAVYGQVENSPLAGPALPPEMRDALDDHLLGLRALTCRFENTPLLGMVEPAVVTNPQLKRLIAATAAAESFFAGDSYPVKQEREIIWIYYNLVIYHTVLRDNGIYTALSKSSEYRKQREKPRFKIMLYLLGDHRYGGDKLPKNKDPEKDEFGGRTVRKHCETDDKTIPRIRPRVESLLQMIDDIVNGNLQNPYTDWTGQGNLEDFNNEKQDGLMWKQARAYWHLQNANPKTVEPLVKQLGPDKIGQVQFIFHQKEIEKYFRTHPLPEEPEKYKPSGH